MLTMLNYRKVGGLHFVRLWRFQFSWCVCRKAAPRQAKRQAKRQAVVIQAPRIVSSVIDGQRVLLPVD